MRAFLLRLNQAAGQGLTEYALILGGIGVVAIVALTAMGGQVAGFFSPITQGVLGAHTP